MDKKKVNNETDIIHEAKLEFDGHELGIKIIENGDISVLVDGKIAWSKSIYEYT